MPRKSLSPERTWLLVAAASVAVVAVSAAMAVLSVTNDNLIGAVASVASIIVFSACAFLAWKIHSRLVEINNTPEEINCLRLKKPGIIREEEEEIVPKGKMPEERD
jgi:Na+/melibiose symporter-like transporter